MPDPAPPLRQLLDRVWSSAPLQSSHDRAMWGAWRKRHDPGAARVEIMSIPCSYGVAWPWDRDPATPIRSFEQWRTGRKPD